MTSWRELAGRFADKEWIDSLDQGVLDYLKHQPQGKPLLVACSGGADSVFLAMVLYSGLPDAAKRLQLVHFNHGVRGLAASEDAEFVRELADGLGIPFHLGQPGTPLQKDEASLREARYAWMVEVYHELDAVGLFLGHHADDLVESMLMAVLTGSGPGGMASPIPVKRFSDGHVRLRPMLTIRREEITACLDNCGIPWREDSSNQETGYLRNWLRHECIPSLRQRIPQDIYSGTQRTRKLMEECMVGLDEAARNLGIHIENKAEFDVNCLIGQPRALVRRAFMSWWIQHHPGEVLGKGAVDAVVGFIHHGTCGKSVDIGKGQALVLNGQYLLGLSAPDSQNALVWPSGIHWSWQAGPLFLPEGGCLKAQRLDWIPDETPPCLSADPETTAWLNWEGKILHVRQWEPGDRYRPLGAPGKRKLQDMFVDAKLSVEQKRNRPVLTNIDGDILWVPGFPPADDLRIIPGCNSGLKLTYQSQ